MKIFNKISNFFRKLICVSVCCSKDDDVSLTIKYHNNKTYNNV